MRKSAMMVGLKCQNCGQVAPAGDEFCSRCGRQLAVYPQPARQPAAGMASLAEASKSASNFQREVAVMFVGLVTSAFANQPPDDEDVYNLRNDALQILLRIVEKYGGIVDKFIGDGFVALFGIKLTHKNETEQAIRAALEMRAANLAWRETCQPRNDFTFQLQIGIHAGLAVTSKIGSQLWTDYRVSSQVVNLASLLEMTAKPDTTLVSAEIFQRTQTQFEFKVLAPQLIEWQPRAIQVYQLLNLKEVTN